MKKSLKLNNTQCAPGIITHSNSCFTYKQLKTIAQKYNDTQNKSNKIEVDKNKSKLWIQICEKMKPKCSDEKCWAAELDETLLKRFKPDKPIDWIKNPRQWLTNHDINNIMCQYENKSFKFVGVFPMDWNIKIKTIDTCVSEELCTINIQNLIKGKTKYLGIVFNTDNHYESGSHWVSVFIGLTKNNKYGFYYYDSNAQKSSDYIKDLYLKIKHDIDDDKFHFVKNHIKHQFKNTECGMFAMDFIISMLNENKTFKTIINEDRNDDEMNFKRNEFFYNKL
jgi:hypothetical protein